MAQPDDNNPNEEDFYSAYSLASTHADLVLEHGRRFPNYRYASQFFARGDDIAARHESITHNWVTYMNGNKLYTAPIDQPKNVLDVRSGMHGLWARNMADIFPDAQITGFDQFIPSTEGRENLVFVLQSYNDTWILDEITQIYGKLDFIYARALFAGSEDYAEFYRQCLEHLEPGGYLEESEIVPICSCDDDTGHEDSLVKELSHGLRAQLEAHHNRDYNHAESMKSMIEKAGFVDVQEHKHIIPWSPWPEKEKDPRGHELGRLFQKWYETGIQAWILQPCVKYLKMTPDQVNELCARACQELAQNDQHWYSQCITVTARKPGTSTSS